MKYSAVKTKEFIEKVEDLGFSVEENYKQLLVKNEHGRTVMTTEMSSWGNINTNYPDFKYMEDFEGFDTRWRLLEAAFEYVFTLVEEREEPKKYYLRLPNLFGSEKVYLNYWVEGNEYFFDCKEHSKVDKTQFTQEEIDNLPNQEFFQSLIKEEVE